MKNYSTKLKRMKLNRMINHLNNKVIKKLFVQEAKQKLELDLSKHKDQWSKQQNQEKSKCLRIHHN
jgi:hypothetical protein